MQQIVTLSNPYTVEDYTEMSKWLCNYVDKYKLSINFLSYKLGIPKLNVQKIKDFKPTGDTELDLSKFTKEANIMRVLLLYVEKLNKGKAKILSTELDFDYLENEYLLEDNDPKIKQEREKKELDYLLNKNNDFKILNIPIKKMPFIKHCKMFMVLPNLAPVGFHRVYLATQYKEYKTYLESQIRGRMLSSSMQEYYKNLIKNQK